MFKFCRIGKTNLVCYDTGLILRFHKYQKKWTVCEGTLTDDGYLRMKIDGKMYMCHRVLGHVFDILDLNSPLKIDHIDRDRTNNSISNFRAVTIQQNNFNTDAKGYTWHDNKWEARIDLDGKRIHLGSFTTEQEAHQKYLDAKLIYHII